MNKICLKIHDSQRSARARKSIMLTTVDCMLAGIIVGGCKSILRYQGHNVQPQGVEEETV